MADVMAHGGYTQGRLFVVVAPEHRVVIERAGWSKADVRAYLVEHARRSTAALKRAGYLRGAVSSPATRSFRSSCRTRTSDSTAGGTGGTFSAVVPPWGRRALVATGDARHRGVRRVWLAGNGVTG